MHPVEMNTNPVLTLAFWLLLLKTNALHFTLQHNLICGTIDLVKSLLLHLFFKVYASTKCPDQQYQLSSGYLL